MTSSVRDSTLGPSTVIAHWRQTCGAWLTRLCPRRTTTVKAPTHYVMSQSGAGTASIIEWRLRGSLRLLGSLSETPRTPTVVTTPSTLSFVSGGSVWKLRLESQGPCTISMDDDGFSLRSSRS